MLCKNWIQPRNGNFAGLWLSWETTWNKEPMESVLLRFGMSLFSCKILYHCFNANFVPLESLSWSWNSLAALVGADIINVDWQRCCNWCCPSTETIALQQEQSDINSMLYHKSFQNHQYHYLTRGCYHDLFYNLSK